MAKAHTGLPVAHDDVLAARETIGDRLHRTPTFSSATLSARIGGPPRSRRSSSSARLVQAARDAERPRAPVAGGEGARRHHHLRRERGAGPRLLRALEGIDCLVVMWRGASAGEGGGDARVRSRGRPGGAGAGRGVRAARNAAGGDRPRLRPLLRRPTPDRGPRNARRSRCSRTSPTWRHVVVPIGGGGLISGIATAVKGVRPKCESSVSSRSFRRRCTSRSRQASRSPSSRARSRTG